MLLNTVTGHAGLIAAAFAEKLLGRQIVQPLETAEVQS
jgi:hypothetical protein